MYAEPHLDGDLWRAAGVPRGCARYRGVIACGLVDPAEEALGEEAADAVRAAQREDVDELQQHGNLRLY